MKSNDTRVWVVLRRAAHWVQLHALQSLSSLSLGLSDFAVLNTLHTRGPLPVNVIGQKVLLTSSSITAAVDRLENQGLVERRNHDTDRRTWIVHLTKKGEGLIRPTAREHTRTMADLISVLSDAEQSELRRLLKKLGLHAMKAVQEPASAPTAAAEKDQAPSRLLRRA